MIVNDDMVVADVLGSGRETGDILRVGADLRLRKYNAWFDIDLPLLANARLCGKYRPKPKVPP